MMKASSIETEVKSVIFYDGPEDLHTDTFVHVYFEGIPKMFIILP